MRSVIERWRRAGGGWRNRVSRLIRDSAGHRLSRGARSLHTLSLHASGYGTGQLPPARSGERGVLELLDDETSPTILDVGAFCGDYSVMAREVLGPAAIIHCFEPGETGLRRLRQRAAQADLRVHAIALGDRTGSATLHHDPVTPTMASLHPATLTTLGRHPTEHTAVELTTLDDFCERLGLSRVALLKIDTEGTEIDVLRGASRMLGDEAFRIIQFEFGYGDVATRTFLRDFYDVLGSSYRLYRVAPRGLIPLGDYDLSLEVFVGATNYIALARAGDVLP